MATVAVGDVHGNLTALEDLLLVLTPELSESDTVVFLGDYIDRGPDTKACVERIIQLQENGPCRIITLMGNHEQWMLKTMRNPCSHSWLLGMEAFETIASYSGAAAEVLRESLERNATKVILEKHPLPYSAFFSELPSKHIEFLEGLLPYYRTTDVICAHAGIDLEGGLESVDPDVFVWGTEAFPQDYRGDEDVVYGHWNNAVTDESGWPRPCIKENRTFGIDTISCGVLTAMRFPDKKVYQSKRFRN